MTELLEIPCTIFVEAENNEQATELILQMSADYFKHYPDSKVESVRVD